MSIKVNTAKYFKELEKAQALTLAACKKTIQKTALEIYTKIKDYTPVGDPSLWNYPPHKDYIPGTLKAAWRLNLNGNDVSTTGGLAVKLTDTANFIITIYNLNPYAERVENGWSTQAPSGMMRRAAMEFSKTLDQIAKTEKL